MLKLFRKHIFTLGFCLLPCIGFCGCRDLDDGQRRRRAAFVSIDKGQKVGLDVDLVGAVLREAGVDADHRGVPWNRALQMLDRAGQIWAFRSSLARYSARYILVGPIRLGRSALVGVAGTRIEFKQFSDLKRFVVATVQGYAYSPDFDHATGVRKDQTRPARSAAEKS